ncbi:hypothetical protein CEE37_13420 [candidate division LCP-89 bacterium B3_LCP]|uniref:DUF6946 domain-containing protein n=1 Tax=candidate division LCP-89 bacterium B3_LCP TaxID=2012998 RepID=A0A532USR4_UNCL8|nr:MAG: hypothetical protein CEE37_13420 [candidate division LCP-89 bacterium B3_LCP]
MTTVGSILHGDFYRLHNHCWGNNNMKQKRIFVPTEGFNTWKQFLTEPDKHWKQGFSAMSTALSWEKSDELPPEIKAIFTSAEDENLRDAQLVLAIPEYKVVLDGGPPPSQNDVFALVTSSGGLIAMMVEGKAREDFDVPLEKWRQRTSIKGVHERMAQISENIGLSEPIPNHIRYQFLHRTASAVIETKRFFARYAIMLVQSFVENDDENHFDDFIAFIELYGKKAKKGTLIRLYENTKYQLYAAWVQCKIE